MATADNVVRQLLEEGRGCTRGEQLAYIVEHRSHDIDVFDLFDACMWYGVLDAMDMLTVAHRIPDGHIFDRFQELVMEYYCNPAMRQHAIKNVPLPIQDIISRQFDIVFGLDMVALLNDALRPSSYVFRPVESSDDFSGEFKKWDALDLSQ